jgi:predicted permease
VDGRDLHLMQRFITMLAKMTWKSLRVSTTLLMQALPIAMSWLFLIVVSATTLQSGGALINGMGVFLSISYF